MLRLALLSTAAFGFGLPAFGASDFYGVPNTTTGTAPVNTTFQGQVFVNSGLVGAGRLSANTIDFNGDTLGSFSGMALDLTTWRRNGAGYTGTLYTLPDRGFNAGGFFSNYQGRVHRFTMNFTPYSGPNLPAATTSQSQLTLTPAGGILLNDFNNVATTGEDPAAGTIVQNGFTLPQVQAGFEGAGRVSLDAEAIAFRPDGTFYVGDEYTGGIYYFDATGRMAGFLPPVNAIQPISGGVVNYNSIAQPTTSGRRNNQGMEAVSLTPDGKRLFGVLQSATVQDSTSNQQTRQHTRVLVYDVASNPFPSAPIGHYVLELPRFDRDGTNGSADRTAAQSEILALNNTQFLLLTRDGNGNGNGDSRPHVFKSVYLVDTTPGTNLAGTSFETSATPISPGGVLAAGITPVANMQFVNMLNTTQLTRFGLNLDSNTADLARTNDLLTLSEKWEALGLAPVLEESAPQDFFLFVGNDNDFQSPTGTIQGDAEHNAYNGVEAPNVQNDNLILVYRVTLPTYVDPEFYQAMVNGAPVVVAALGEAGFGLGAANASGIDGQLDSARRAGNKSGSVWGSFSYSDIDPLINGAAYTSEVISGAAGINWPLTSDLGGGFAASYSTGDSAVEGGFGFDYEAFALSAFLGWGQGPWFLQGSLSHSWQDFEDIRRPAAFGLTATGNTDGSAWTFGAKGGYVAPFGDINLGPVAALTFTRASFDAYTETGAGGGNVTYIAQTGERATYALGLEANTQLDGALMPFAHALYVFEEGDADRRAQVKLASANTALASQLVGVPDVAGDYVALGLGIQSLAGQDLTWRAAYEAQIGIEHDEDLTHQLTLGLALRM